MIDSAEECQTAIDELYGSGITIGTANDGVIGCSRVEFNINTIIYGYKSGAYGTGTTDTYTEPICKKPEPPAANGGGGTS